MNDDASAKAPLKHSSRPDSDHFKYKLISKTNFSDVDPQLCTPVDFAWVLCRDGHMAVAILSEVRLSDMKRISANFSQQLNF